MKRPHSDRVGAEIVALAAVQRPGTVSPVLDALDEIERAAAAAGVDFVDVRLQLALARHLASIVGAIALGSEPSVAQVHAIRELRLTTTELRELVVGYSRQR